MAFYVPRKRQHQTVDSGGTPSIDARDARRRRETRARGSEGTSEGAGDESGGFSVERGGSGTTTEGDRARSIAGRDAQHLAVVMSNRERDALLGNDAERARRKAAMDGVERSSVNEERLEQTARTAQESAETGENILSKLHDQREKILSARASAGHMERDMDKSAKRMTQLGCEKCMQRWAVCVLVVLVLGGLSFFLWWKLQHRDEERRRQEREGDVAYAMMASEWANERAHAAARRLLRL